MRSRFSRGSTVYDKNGRSYVVEDVDGELVYCAADNGVESEFPESALITEAEYATRSNGRRDVSYTRLKQSRHYLPPKEKFAAADCKMLLAKLEKLSPGILDFAAYTTAARVLAENKEHDMAAGLSITKCREVWEAASVEARASLMANVLGTPPTVMVGMAHVGEFLMQAMIDKGLAAHGADYQSFKKRPRK